MAQSLCQLKKKGGNKVKEITLWTNGSPSSSFSNQTVSFNESYSDYSDIPYDYIEIQFKVSTSNATEGSVCIPKNSYNSISDSSVLRPCLGIYDTAFYNRSFRLSLSNSQVGMKFGDCTKTNASGVLNTACIPTKIIGLKY